MPSNPPPVMPVSSMIPGSSAWASHFHSDFYNINLCPEDGLNPKVNPEGSPIGTTTVLRSLTSHSIKVRPKDRREKISKIISEKTTDVILSKSWSKRFVGLLVHAVAFSAVKKPLKIQVSEGTGKLGCSTGSVWLEVCLFVRLTVKLARSSNYHPRLSELGLRTSKRSLEESVQLERPENKRRKMEEEKIITMEPEDAGNDTQDVSVRTFLQTEQDKIQERQDEALLEEAGTMEDPSTVDQRNDQENGIAKKRPAIWSSSYEKIVDLPTLNWVEETMEDEEKNVKKESQEERELLDITKKDLVARATGSLKDCLDKEPNDCLVSTDGSDIRSRPWTENGRTGITFLVPQIKISESTPPSGEPDTLQKLLDEAQVNPETVEQMSNLSPGDSDLLRMSPGDPIQFDLQAGFDYEVDDCDEGITAGGFYGADHEEGEGEEGEILDVVEDLRADGKDGEGVSEDLRATPVSGTEGRQPTTGRANVTSTPILGGLFSSWGNRTVLDGSQSEASTADSKGSKKRGRRAGVREQQKKTKDKDGSSSGAVSYTHLTLTTIYSV